MRSRGGRVLLSAVLCLLPAFARGAADRVLVLPFTAASAGAPDPGIGLAIADLAVVALSGGAQELAVVDRKELNRALAELRVSYGGLAPAEQLKLGKMTAATRLLGGSFSRGADGAIRVEARLTSMEDSRVLATASASGGMSNVQAVVQSALAALLGQRVAEPADGSPSGRLDAAPLDANQYLQALARHSVGMDEEAIGLLLKVGRDSPYAPHRRAMLVTCFTKLGFLSHAAVEVSPQPNAEQPDREEIAKFVEAFERTKGGKQGDPAKGVQLEPSPTAGDGKGTTMRIAVLDFGNLTREEAHAWRGIAVADTLIRLLHRAEGLSVLDRENVRTILKEANLADAGILDPVQVVRLARIEPVERLVSGGFSISGPKLTMEATTIEPLSGKTLARHAVEGDAEDIQDLCKTLAIRLMADLTADGAKGQADASILNAPQLPRDGLEVYCKGVRLLDRGESADAIPYLLMARRIMPDHGGAYYHGGAALRALGETGHALASYEAGLEKAADSAWIYRLAQSCGDICFLELNSSARAFGFYDLAYRTIQKRNDRGLQFSLLSQSAFRMANCFEQMGRWAEALTLYDRALYVLPDFDPYGKRLFPDWAFDGMLRSMDRTLIEKRTTTAPLRFVHWLSAETPSYAGDCVRGQDLSDAFYVSDQGHSDYAAKYLFAAVPPRAVSSLRLEMTAANYDGAEPPYRVYVTPAPTNSLSSRPYFFTADEWRRTRAGAWETTLTFPAATRRFTVQVSSSAGMTVKPHDVITTANFSPAALGVAWRLEAEFDKGEASPTVAESPEEGRSSQESSVPSGSAPPVPIHRPTFAVKAEGGVLVAFCDNNDASAKADIWLGNVDAKGLLIAVRRFPLCSEEGEICPDLFLRRDGSYLLLWCLKTAGEGQVVQSAASADGTQWKGLGKVDEVKGGYGPHATVAETPDGTVHAIFAQRHATYEEGRGWACADLPGSITTSALWAGRVMGTEVYVPESEGTGMLFWVHIAREYMKTGGPMYLVRATLSSTADRVGMETTLLREGTRNYYRVRQGMDGNWNERRAFTEDWIAACQKLTPALASPEQRRRLGWITAWPGAFMDGTGAAWASRLRQRAAFASSIFRGGSRPCGGTKKGGSDES